MESKEIVFETDRVCEFIFSLFRIGQAEEMKKLAKQYNIDTYPAIDKYVAQVLDALSDKNKQVLKAYFGNTLGIGLALLSRGQSVEDFIYDLKKLSNIEMAYYMLVTWSEIRFTISDLENIVKENRIFTWIEENFAVSAKDKWQIMKVLNSPEEVKEELVIFLTYYYENFYQPNEEKIIEFLDDYIKENKEKLDYSFGVYLNYILSAESKEELISSNGEVGALISYYFDIGCAYATGGDGIALGFRFSELADKLTKKEENIMDYIPFFKVLADETRLKVLLEINESPKYLAQLADIMESSNPAISYHINKLFEIGLIEIESSDSRTYYQVKKEKFADLIKIIKTIFLS